MDDLIYVCMSCGHEDNADRFGKLCPACGTDLDELEGLMYGDEDAPRYEEEEEEEKEDD